MSQSDYDVVIIGSGAGGGTIASELSKQAKSDLRIALLERGGAFQAQDNTRKEFEMASKYYVDGGGVQNVDRNMTFAFAEALGGSTTVYTGTSLMMSKEAIERWKIPGLTHDDLWPRYQKFIQENNVHLLPRDQLNQNNLLFERACQELKWKVHPFPVNVKNCAGLGTCNLGCSQLSKQGTDRVQIPNAVARGVDVYTWTGVDHLNGNHVHATTRMPQWGLRPSTLSPGTHLFKAKKIIVAGGVAGSVPLLMRSKGFHELPALGKFFMCHPAMMIVGKHSEPIHSERGHPKSFYCDEFLKDSGFLLETCMYFPFTLSKSITAIGAELDELMSPFHHLQMVLALAADEPLASNHLSLGQDGRARFHYELDKKTISKLCAAQIAGAEILFQSGAKLVHAPGAGRSILTQKNRSDLSSLIHPRTFSVGKVPISAAHLMGGCRMGEDPRVSVTDAWGRVHGHPDIYVADASLFPQCSEVNPYLTVMALADRVAQAVVKDLNGATSINEKNRYDSRCACS